MTSIVDVAKHAKVGVGTASRVLSGKGYASEATRKKVMKAVEELHYVPNELARNLIQNKTNMVAVIVPDLANRFYTSFINEAEYLLRKKGYKTLVCNSFGKDTNEQAFLSMLDQNLVDGVITASNLLSNSSYSKISRPIVSLDSVLSPEIPMICSDHSTGGRTAARMLLDAGCHYIVQFRDTVDLDIRNAESDVAVTIDDFPFVKRHLAFEETVRESGIRYEDFQTVGAKNLNEVREVVRDIYENHPDIDGIMATDIVAIQWAIEALKHGKRIPEDLKIVAYDGTDLLDYFYPSLSSIQQDIPLLAQKCVELLLHQINHEPLEAKRIILPVSVSNHTGVENS